MFFLKHTFLPYLCQAVINPDYAPEFWYVGSNEHIIITFANESEHPIEVTEWKWSALAETYFAASYVRKGFSGGQSKVKVITKEIFRSSVYITSLKCVKTEF